MVVTRSGRGNPSLYTLPPEIRRRIIESALICSEDVVVWSSNEHAADSLTDDTLTDDTLTVIDHGPTKDSIADLAVNLMLADRTTGRAAIAIFYTYNCFRFQGCLDLEPILSWLQCIGYANRERLRQLRFMPLILPTSHRYRRRLPMPGYHLHKHSRDNPALSGLIDLRPRDEKIETEFEKDVKDLVYLLRRSPGASRLILHAYCLEPYLIEALATPIFRPDDPMRTKRRLATMAARKSAPPATKSNTMRVRWQLHASAGFAGSGIAVVWEVALLPDLQYFEDSDRFLELQTFDENREIFTDAGWAIIRETTKTILEEAEGSDFSEAGYDHDDQDEEVKSRLVTRATVAIGDVPTDILKYLPPISDGDDEKSRLAGQEIVCGTCPSCRACISWGKAERERQTKLWSKSMHDGQ
ncbi:hypothetical protein BDZ85DRAFT_258974 [Elsinoe ampelina]|uniref:Uncharacterized protein n=1 Tax=Elsinoe ampelina TaxID=302913 RepID=A0A6A6GG72_9PEZI|nr:hypothetical protein BDZ85DRAFT_258974 [Elsinoe ampelina]